jgi:methylated-DNA-[protein]-cysteine S-methyltransferase
MAIVSCTIKTKLGPMTAAAENNCLCGLWFNGQKYFPPNADEWQILDDNLVFKKLRSWLEDYFAGDTKAGQTSRKVLATAGINVDPAGTAFRKKVWELLLDIPYGKVVSYGSLAKQLGSGSSGTIGALARAVGGAVGHNPISIVLPCHRVIGSGGDLTGYAGGLERKKALLTLEGIAV